jgi:serine/threonine protein kinase
MKEMKVGDVIGNYRIVRPLGQGGMGTVYEVDDVRTGKRLALKVFTPRKGNSPL